MSVVLAIFILTLSGMLLMTIVMILELRRSREFKARAKIGKGSFDIESKK